MTMIVALHLGAYALIAADKRETCQVNGEIKSVISDEVQKLVPWPGGVATGSGYVPLLHDFKTKLENSVISSTDQILEIASECSQRLPLDQVAWKKSTNWLFTYLTDGPSGSITRVAFIESASPEKVSVLEEHRALIWAKIPDFDNQLSQLNRSLKPEKDLSCLAQSVAYHYRLLESLYKYVSSVNSSVSSEFECFVHSPERSGMLASG